jgi:hypothetical protein
MSPLSDDDLAKFLQMEMQRERPEAEDAMDLIEPYGTLGPRYFDREGNPISMRGWMRVREEEGVHVAHTAITETSELSTVWLGLDHSMSLQPDRVPLIFESMYFVFDPRIYNVMGKDMVLEREGHLLARYSTIEQAIAGHDQLIESCKDGTWEGL